MTTTQNPTEVVSPKVNAAATGAVVAGAVTTIAAWLLRQFAGVELPADVQGAVTVVLAAGGAWVAGYLTRDPLRVRS